MKSLVLLSGLDSAVALAERVQMHGARQVRALAFSYGALHNEEEVRGARQVCRHYGCSLECYEIPSALWSDHCTLTGGDGELMGADTVAEFRNGVFLSFGIAWAATRSFSEVVIGCHEGDHAVYADCRPEFVKAMGWAARLGTAQGPEVCGPWLGFTKAMIVKRGAALRVPFQLTYSCYAGRRQHCGECGACQERQKAFREAGVEDPTGYATRSAGR